MRIQRLPCCIAALALVCTMPAPVSAQGAELPPAWLAFEHVSAGIAAYSATVTAFDQKGTQAENIVFEYSFRKPSSATMRIVKGPHTGGTLMWSGGSTVVARLGSGFLAVLSKTYALHDADVTNLRGSSIDQLSFTAIVAHGENTAGAASETTGPVIDGVPTEAVSLIPTTSAVDAGLTLEIVDIASTTNLPVRMLAYDGSTLVGQVQFSNLKLQL